MAGGFAGFALARLAAADRFALIGIPATSLLPFTPQVAVAAWLAALLLADKRASAATATVAASLTSVLVPRVVARRQPTATGPELRVLTSNLLAGRAAADELVGLVRRAAADVLFVQELNDQAATSLRSAGLDRLLPYAITDLAGPEPRGNGIYARYPLVVSPQVMPTSSIQPLVTLKLPAARVRLACVHLYTPKHPWSAVAVARWRSDLAALSALSALARAGQSSAGLPLIVAGDFNSTVDHAAFRQLLAGGLVDAASQAGNGLVPTWGLPPGGRFALLALDHVLADSRCAVLRSSVHALRGTDHRALFAKLRLPDLESIDG